MELLRSVLIASSCDLLLATVFTPGAPREVHAETTRNLQEVRQELTGYTRIMALRAGKGTPAAGVDLPINEHFSLVPVDHWAYPALMHLSDQGLIEGYPSGFFQGDRPLTRYEFAQAMSRLIPSEAGDSETQLAAAALRLEFSEQMLSLEQEINDLILQLDTLQERIGRIQASQE